MAVWHAAADLARRPVRLAMWCGVVLVAMSTDVTIAAAAPGNASTSSVVLALPAPTGRYPVGMTDLDLVDPARADPWRPEQRRELMVHLWYPATDDPRPVAGWMPPGADQQDTDDLTTSGVPPNTWTLGAGHSHQNAPARSSDGPFPLLLYSPGMGDDAGQNVAQAEDLASHGYIVAEINHTHEAFAVVFPDGRTERTMVPADIPRQARADVLLPVRVADVRFVLDELTAMTTGQPALGLVGLAASLDTSRVGMFGHSLGGATTGEAMHEDPRIQAGVNLDGQILGSVAQEGLAQPLLMLASEVSPISTRPGWETVWTNNSGLKLPLLVSGTRHLSFNDQQVILPQLVGAGLLPAASARSAIGTIAPDRSLELQRAYLRTYFHAAFDNADIREALTCLAYPEVVGNT